MTSAPEAAVGEIEPAVRPYRWTREEYRRLLNAGILHEDDQVELIEGELLETMPHDTPHAVAVVLAEDTLRETFGAGYHARAQLPLAFGSTSEPEPDVAVVRGSPRDYLTEHPTTAVLMLEVSDTTLRSDRTRKGSLYAKAGIQDYWIVNISERQLEVYRDPVPAADAPYGFTYREQRRISEDGEIAPLAAPGKPVKVADLLP
ncbi:MAG: Uma2 family endonuclease [Chloroflexi bacterium]|nr:Uma2 family endonuclease [Chloroflexota bacterium]